MGSYARCTQNVINSVAIDQKVTYVPKYHISAYTVLYIMQPFINLIDVVIIISEKFILCISLTIKSLLVSIISSIL